MEHHTLAQRTSFKSHSELELVERPDRFERFETEGDFGNSAAHKHFFSNREDQGVIRISCQLVTTRTGKHELDTFVEARGDQKCGELVARPRSPPLHAWRCRRRGPEALPALTTEHAVASLPGNGI